MEQSKLFDYPFELVKPNPEVRVVRPLRKRGALVYTPKHRDLLEIAVLSAEEAERVKEAKRREIDYHKMRMER